MRLDRFSPTAHFSRWWTGTITGPTIRAALFLGFGLICATWLFAGYYFTRRLADLQSQAATISERYMRAQDLLTTARGHLLEGSVYVRDALLDPDPSTVDEYRARLEEAYRAADEALRQYVPVIDVPGERGRIGQLRAETDDFRSTVLQILATDSSRWRTDALALLRRQIVPKRESVLHATDEMQALNRAAFVQQQINVAAISSATHRRLWESFGLAVLVSLGIALLATAYAGRLEDRIHRQRVKELESARDLQRLSSKLVTVQEEERRVIARELHDEVGQALTAIKVELAVAERVIDAAGAPSHVLDSARQITDGALHTVRDLSRLLHPAILDDLGLVAAVDWYLKGFGKRHGLSVDLLIDRMENRVAADTEAAAFRIVQEALTNVVRHAQASTCRVYLQRLTNTLLVTIEDDGVGFEVAADSLAASGGLGLIGIRERASHLGGALRVESAPGRGTRVTVELPAGVPFDQEIEAVPSVSMTAREVVSG